MRINSIRMNRFGKFRDFSLSFENGFNMLYGENEQGKSTIMAFIRMMLYGSASREKDLSKNIRKKYTPWDGSKMSGSMEFSHEGVHYRLEKTFGATPKNDIVKLWNQSTNETEQLTEQKDIGRRFFGMGEDTFEKSVFIGQIASVINADNDKENEIIQKLQNLVSSGDETQSFNLVESRLQAAAEKIISKSGKIGILDRLKQARLRLEDEKTEAIAMEAEKERLQKAYQDLLEKKTAEEKTLEEKNRLFEEIRQFRRYRDLQRILSKHKEVEDLEKAWTEAAKPLINGDFNVDAAYIEELKRQMQEIVPLQAILQSKYDELSRQEQSAGASTVEDTNGISKDEYESVREQYEKILSGQKRKEAMQSSLRQEEFAMKEALLFETALQENASGMEGYKQKIEQLKMEETQPVPTQGKVRFPIAAFLIGSALLIACLAAGYLFHPLAYIGSALPALLLFILWTHYSAKKREQAEAARIHVETAKEKNNRIQSDISFYQKQWNGLFEKQKKLRQDRLNEENAEQRSSGEIRLFIEKTRASIEEIENDQKLQQTEMTEIFTRFRVVSFEELREKYFETQNRIQRRMDAAKELEARKELLGVKQEELAIKLKALADYFSQAGVYFEPDETNTAGKMIDKVKERIEELARQENDVSRLLPILEERKKNLQPLMAGRSISLVRQEFLALSARYDQGELHFTEPEPANEEMATLEKQIETLTDNRNSILIDLARMKSEMGQSFLDKPELSLIEERILLNEAQQVDYQTRHSELILAKTQMEQAFLEMQQTFGPMVNKRTADIFSKITNGKYQELLVSKDLNISFREPLMNTTQEWQYLSGGTIDQVYFSLRLAIAGFLADRTGGLPLFLDDAFLQYDDARTRQSLLFLEEYATSRQTQILFFTCHRSLYDQSGDGANHTDLSARDAREEPSMTADRSGAVG